jgi:AraC-like DNA-binding protein
VCPGDDADGLARVSDALANVRTHRDGRSSFFTLPLRMLLQRPPRLDRPIGADLSRDLAPMPDGDFLASMRCLVESLVMGGLSDLATAADTLGMSTRTLQRRLALHGVEYSRLVEEARIARAEGWLRQADFPVADIARALGYRDPSNFARAFRRVNGMSPRAYRALTKAQQPVAARG